MMIIILDDDYDDNNSNNYDLKKYTLKSKEAAYLFPFNKL